jgi:drug/metabolite transporter (DMT)-like permease
MITPIRLLILAVIIAGAGPVLVRESPVGPASTAFWRLSFALPFAWWLAREVLPLSPRDMGWAMLSGLLLAADLILWNSAILRTSVMEATILVMMFPILVAVGEIALFGRHIGKKLIMGGAIALVGTIVIAINSSHGESNLIGDLMALAAAVFYAGSLLISAQLCQRIDTRSVTFWLILGGACGTLPVGLTEEVFAPRDLYGWSYLGLYGTITFGSYALYNRALSSLPTTLVAISGYGQPVIATGLAMVLLGEIPTATAFLGAAIVIIGLLIATIDKQPT